MARLHATIAMQCKGDSWDPVWAVNGACCEVGYSAVSVICLKQMCLSSYWLLLSCLNHIAAACRSNPNLDQELKDY